MNVLTKLPPLNFPKSLLATVLSFVGFALHLAATAGQYTEILVSKAPAQITIDGILSESIYRQAPSVGKSFVVAGAPEKSPQPTSAWLFWESERLVIAFDCTDADIVASAPSENERGVDAQDRVEVFLWSGDENDTYYCIEVSPSGAVHDYAARFYRKFDDSWSLQNWQYAVKMHPTGYRTEIAIPARDLAAIGLDYEREKTWRIGLFRADFSSERPDAPDWITWVDSRTAEPDFHVAESFGSMRFED